MVFTSTIFLFIFLPITIIGYFCSNIKIRNIWLLLVSLIFYSYGEPKFMVLMLISIVINYLIGLLLEKLYIERYRKILVFIAVLVDFGLLVIYKYYNFIILNLNKFFKLELSLINLILPIGISFYTFQIFSYIIDVYRRETRAQKSIINLALYISFFPQLIAGPIVRYVDIEKQINDRKVSTKKFYSGIKRFMTGFSKKILIADTVSRIADIAFESEIFVAPLTWIGILAYTIQIYFDFSGYSDMAIGLGRMFGFEFLENFNYPYISKSIKEFWRRWHISLGTWFRSYLYIPLGGNRISKNRTYFNLILVFILTGLWHGASWNFIVWGAYYAVFIVMEQTILKKIINRTPLIIQHLYTLVVVIIGWIFFRADSLKIAIRYIKGMFIFNFDKMIFVNISVEELLFMLIGCLLSFPLLRKIRKYFIKMKNVTDTIILISFILAIFYMIGSGFSPFLYFRF